MASVLDIPEMETEARFPIAPPDRSPASENQRQVTFRKLMRQLAPSVLVYANTNAGKRGPKAIAQAKREGLTSGVPDVTVAWSGGVAWIEWKNARDVPESNQIDIGNCLYDFGHHVACHRDPMAAVAWLRSIGCPVREAK